MIQCELRRAQRAKEAQRVRQARPRVLRGVMRGDAWFCSIDSDDAMRGESACSHHSTTVDLPRCAISPTVRLEIRSRILPPGYAIATAPRLRYAVAAHPPPCIVRYAIIMRVRDSKRARRVMLSAPVLLLSWGCRAICYLHHCCLSSLTPIRQALLHAAATMFRQRHGDILALCRW